MNNIPWHLVIFVVAILFSALQGILRKMKQARDARKIEEETRQIAETQLRTGHLAPSREAPPAPIDHATAQQRLREIAQRRQAQLEELRRRAAQRAGQAVPAPRPTARAEAAASADPRTSFEVGPSSPVATPYPPSQRAPQRAPLTRPTAALPTRPGQSPRARPGRQNPPPAPAPAPARQGPPRRPPETGVSGMPASPSAPLASPFASTPAAGAHWETEHSAVHRLVPDDDTVTGRAAAGSRGSAAAGSRGASGKAGAGAGGTLDWNAAALVPRSAIEWRRALIAMEVLSPPPSLRSPAEGPMDVALAGLPPPAGLSR